MVKLDGNRAASQDDLVPGESYDVFVVVPFADYYTDEYPDPANIKLLEGPRIIAVGLAVGPIHELAPEAVLDQITKSSRADEERQS